MHPSPIRGPNESAVPEWERTSTPARPDQMDYILEALDFEDLFQVCDEPGPRAKRRRLIFTVSVLIDGGAVILYSVTCRIQMKIQVVTVMMITMLVVSSVASSYIV